MELFRIIILSISLLIIFSSKLSGQKKPIINYEGSSTISHFISDAQLIYDKADFKIKSDTESAGGERSIIEGTSDLGGVAKIPSPQVLGKGVVSTLIGWDAIVVIVNKANGIQNLTREQLKEIFTNKITNWKDLGGEDIPIKPFIVTEESATRNVFRSRILGAEDYVNCFEVSPDSLMAQTVAEEPGSIGQISLSFINQSLQPVNAISVSGEHASVINQNYPITRPLYLLWWPERKLIADFVEWIQTSEAQNLITKRFIGKTQENFHQKGKLIVYSKSIPHEEGGSYFYSHEPYDIFSKDGALLQTIDNRTDPTDENPTIVNLNPGQYLIWTDSARKNNTSKILVNVEAQQITKVKTEAGLKNKINSLEQKALVTDLLQFSGDFRFRFEQDWRSLNSDGVYRNDRGRLRYRLRFGFNYQLNKQITFGARLRSGSDDNKQSPHITLGNANHTISLDKAYARFTQSKFWSWVGKNNFPFYKQNEMWWDDDVTPEGIAMGNKISFSSNFHLKPVLGYFVLNSLGGQLSKNPSLIASQLKLEFNHKVFSVNLASGYYRFTGLEDKNIITNAHIIDYNLINSSLEIKLKTKSPVVFGIDNMINTSDYSNDFIIANTNFAQEKIGYVLSFKYGSLNKKGSMIIAYYYAHVPKYAVVDFLAQDDWVRWSFSNSNATRSSNFKGHEFRYSYAITDGLNLVARLYLVKAIEKESNSVLALETGNRFRIDFNFKF